MEIYASQRHVTCAEGEVFIRKIMLLSKSQALNIA